MQLLEDVREKAGDLCPGCRRPKNDCIIYLTRHELDGFAALPSVLDADDDYGRFYRRFRVAISRLDEEHLSCTPADEDLTMACFTDALFGAGSGSPGGGGVERGSLEAFGVPWHSEPPSSVDVHFDASSAAAAVSTTSLTAQRLVYRIDTPTGNVFVELRNTYNPDDIGPDFLESVGSHCSSGDVVAGCGSAFYLMTLHCGHTQRDYERYRRQFGTLASYARRLNGMELRHVNVLPFYGNEESIAGFVEGIRR